MAGISSLSGVQSAVQSGARQLRLQQAERDARQAEQIAQALQGQAHDAQLKSRDAQEEARAIASQADQAQSTAGQARRGLAAIRSVGELHGRLSDTLDQVAERQNSAVPATPPQGAAPPVINAQGQVTGSVINTTA